MSDKKGPFQKERLVFQSLFFRGELIVFGGSSFDLGVTSACMWALMPAVNKLGQFFLGNFPKKI